MISQDDHVTDVEPVSENAVLYPTPVSDATEAITAENAAGMLSIKGKEVPEQNQPTQEQILSFMQMMRAKHNAKCRKKGFKDHIHQPAGNKLARKLARQGSLYGRLSLVDEMMKDVRERKFKDAKENAASIPHETNTDNPIDFPKVRSTHVAEGIVNASI